MVGLAIDGNIPNERRDQHDVDVASFKIPSVSTISD
jgi:hypothetical protein